MLRPHIYAKCLYNLFALSFIFTFQSSVSADAQQQEKARALSIVGELISTLDSNDIHTAEQAASELGRLRAKEAVPALLTLLRSPRSLSGSEHVHHSGGLSYWVGYNVKSTAVTSLGEIGDMSAVPALERYLTNPPKEFEVGGRNVAHALYQITGTRYEYQDRDGELKLYAPHPRTEEEVRMRLRPDLAPTEGLTAFLETEQTGPSVTWVGSKPLALNLTITNHSKKEIKLEISPRTFVFSCVVGSGERVDVSADELPTVSPRAGDVVIGPGGAVTLRWRIEVLKESPLSRGWVGYVSVKNIYTNPTKNKGETYWKGDQLISNTVQQSTNID
jgi:hypothetical protein